jgi:hypothetical protein
MTFETKRLIRKLCAFALVALFGAMLAGCGGGGGDGADPEAENRELAALQAARAAASDASDAAKTASDAAAAAVNAVQASSGADAASYALAVLAAGDAMDASTAAKAASDAAAAAATSADAAMYQAQAEAAQADAETAQANAVMYAGMVMDAATELMALNNAQGAAMTALDAAEAARDAAMEAVEAQRADKDINTVAAAAFARAEDAAAEANEAYLNAVAANTKAQAATTSADAAMYQKQVEDARAAAEIAQVSAQTFAGMVATIKQTMDDATVEVTALDDAQAAAKTAAEAARQAANDAETAAVEAEGAAPGSSDARKARAAADAAETAALAAEAASMRAQAATDSADAITEQMTAETQKGEAESQLMYAQNSRDDAQDARLAAEQLQEERDIEDAQEAAMEASEDALGHYNEAVGKATMARAQANAARAAANRAKAARTDYANANTHATAAETAASEAEAAQVRAATAKDDANTAYMAAMGADNSVDAEMYQDQAEAANEAAAENHTGMTGAGMAYMRAKDAAGKAAMAASTHVRDLLRAANASGESNADNRMDEVMAVATVIKASASSADHGSSGTTATVTWAHDEPDIAATEDVDESAVTLLSMMVNPGGDGALDFNRMTVAADPDATPPVEGVTKTATKITGLPGFMHGYEISSGRQHVLVFTDKVQGTGPATAKTVSFLNRAVQIGRISDVTTGETVTDLATLGTHTTYDHDGDSDTLAVSGTYSCVPTGECAPQLEDGKVTGFVGDGTVYFSTTGDQEITAVVNADPKNDYLVFGVWLREDDPDNQTNDRAVGAFAGSHNQDSQFATPEALTGSATYNGSAAGLYTEGTAVDYFQGVATLTARFGTAEADVTDAEEGTITGTINSIVAGGRNMSDVIRLNSDGDPRTNEAPDAGNIATTGSFAGNARMGAPEVDGDLVVYPYNGTWTGQFYGAEAETGATGVALLPPAAAGTFGVSGTEGTGDDAVTRSYVGAFGARR